MQKATRDLLVIGNKITRAKKHSACINMHIETQDDLEKAKAPIERYKENNVMNKMTATFNSSFMFVYGSTIRK